MSIRANVVLALMLLAAICIPAFGQATGQDWMDKGNDLYAQGNYSGAIKAYDRAVEKPDGWNATAAYLMKADLFLKGALSNRSYMITIPEFLNISANDSSWVILDIREPGEYLDGHIKGAMNIPSTELIANIKKFLKARGWRSTALPTRDLNMQ